MLLGSKSIALASNDAANPLRFVTQTHLERWLARMIDGLGRGVRVSGKWIVTRRRRSAIRTQVRQTALVYDPATRSAFRCKILNRSSSGWRVQFPEKINAGTSPLWVVDVDAAVAYDARIVWQARRDAGLSMGKPMYLDQPRIADLWQQALRNLTDLDPVSL